MNRQFDNLRATELHCPKCRELKPVREKLLLVIPNGEIHAYRCTTCGEILATREIHTKGKVIVAP